MDRYNVIATSASGATMVWARNCDELTVVLSVSQILRHIKEGSDVPGLWNGVTITKV